MDFTKKDIEKLAGLARIELTEEEKERFAKQISSILDYVKQVQEIDASAIKDFTYLLELTNIWREDEIEQSKETKKIINQFPEKAGNLNKVKAVLE